MRKKIIAVLCVLSIGLGYAPVNAWASEADFATEVGESAEAESDIALQGESAEADDIALQGESAEADESITEESSIILQSKYAASGNDAAEDAVAEDPQAGTSMSNMEEEPIGLLGSLYQISNYTSNTYLHNDRYEVGYNIVNGIDVSYHNGTIDWAAVKAAGIDYAIIRVGYRGLSNGGLYEDTMFRTNIEGALNAGIQVGVYIFSQATTTAEAEEEAYFIASRIGGYRITLPVTIDYEYGVNNTGRLAEAGLDIDTATAVVNAFCVATQSYGYTPMIYANKTMLQTGIRGEVLDDYYKIWLANYTTQTTYGGEYYAWQYSSSGNVNGIYGNVDCDFFYVKTNYENAKNYVTRLYQNFLERDPDEAGANYYATEIANGNKTAVEVAEQLLDSDEFKNKNYSNDSYVTRLYGALLARSASDSEREGWVTALENGVSQKYVLAQIAGSAEFAAICSDYGITPGSVALTENRDQNYNVTSYVMRCYRQILGRTADVEGLNTWTGKLLDGCSGAEIVKDLVVSQEFTNQGNDNSEFVAIMYRAMLGREADEAGKADWESVLDAGVSYRYVINGFAGSTEFGNLCAAYGLTAGTVECTESRDVNAKVTEFVNRNYNKALDRNADVAGLNDWCSILLNHTQTPQEVAQGFVFSQESYNKQRSNEDFVEMLYGLCLGRASDEAGKADWVSQLDAGASRESVYWGFANSTEFSNIIASYGL
jgi:GH25 family lysozyme M1 (1,4-beta-N-acetylmuramidase)